MKFPFPLAIALHLGAASSVLGADDPNRTFPNANLLRSEKAASPIIRANASSNGSSAAQRFAAFIANIGMNRIPDYCYDDADHDCYTKGVPRCCIKSGLRCSAERPSCDNEDSLSLRLRKSINVNEFCDPKRDICTDGCDCIDGICQRVQDANIVPADGTCQEGIDICVNGYSCQNGRCNPSNRRIVIIRPGDTCQAGIDDCESGYFCIDGTCQMKAIIGAGKVCQAGIDECVSGYSCINGRCYLPFIPAGGSCREGIDICVNGYTCINDICKVAPTTIGAGQVCQVGVDECISGYSCINGRCELTPIPAGGSCRTGIDTCTDGNYCLDGKCGSAGWYASDTKGHCVMSCPTSAGACCGGEAQSWNHVHGSADACCNGETRYEGTRSECKSSSNACLRGD